MSEIKRHEEDVHDEFLDNKLNLYFCDDHKQNAVFNTVSMIDMYMN